ncbi:hypothetical protein CTZ27_33245 [Streptomyces griseocarneus]|nr:hypothetical protein CTZ27_33245 [Streptomyces griseocarneus]
MNPDPARVDRAIRRSGYAVVPSFIPPALLREFADELAGQLLPNQPGGSLRRLREWRPTSEEQLRLREAGYRTAAQHKLTHYRPLADLMAALLDGPVWAQPRRFLRLVAPSTDTYGTDPHQDYRYVQGAVDTLTAWIPLHLVLADESSLRVVQGSHKNGLWPITDATDGALPHPVGIAADDDRWCPLTFYPGDIAIFHSLTLHCTTPPQHDLARLSLDVRYQRTDAPVAASALLAPYPCPNNDDPLQWTHDPQLALPDPLPTVVNVPHDEVVLPDGASRFV